MTLKTTKTPSSVTPANRPTNNLVFLATGGVAVVLALVFILVSSSGDNSDLAMFAAIPQSRTADGAFVLGNPDAPVTLVEYLDFRCPACQQIKPTIDQFITRFVAAGQAKYELRIMETAGGDVTGYAYQLLECAAAQRPGAEWEAYVLLFEYGSRGGYNMNMARPFAERLNLNLNELFTCQRTATQIDADTQLARQLGLTSTPSLLVRYQDGPPQPISNTTIEGLAAIVQAAQLRQ